MVPGQANDTFDMTEWNDEAYRDVYVLSLPAFRWFRAGTPDTYRRNGHECSIIGNRHMLVRIALLFVQSRD